MGALCVILGAWSWDTKKVREFGSLRRAGFEEAHLVARLLGVGLAEHERGGDGQVRWKLRREGAVGLSCSVFWTSPEQAWLNGGSATYVSGALFSSGAFANNLDLALHSTV